MPRDTRTSGRRAKRRTPRCVRADIPIPLAGRDGVLDGEDDGGPLPPGRYPVDPHRTVVHFTIRKLGLFPVHGRFTRASGTLDVAEDVHLSRLVAAVEASSVTTRDPADSGRVSVVAEATLRRSSFGVTAYRWLAGDQLHVRVEAELGPARTPVGPTTGHADAHGAGGGRLP